MKAHPRSILAELEKLEGNGSVAAKKKVCEDHLDVPEFVKTIEYALNPYRQYYTTTIPGLAEVTSKIRQDEKQTKRGQTDLFEEDEKWAWSKQFEKMFALLDDMASQKLPPNSGQSRAAVLEWARHCGAGTVEVFRRIINKDLRIGMTEKSFNKIKPDWIPTFNVQLAQPFDQTKLKFPCYVDPKYDGQRCMCFVDPNSHSVTFMSRNGNQFYNFDNFADELCKIFAPMGCAVVVDTEVINQHGFQTLMKTPKFKDPNFDASHLRMMVFDFIPQSAFTQQSFDMVQERRIKELKLLFGKMNTTGVFLVDTRIAKDFVEAEQLFEMWINAGLEGIIMKQPDGKYEFRRSNAWLKMKGRESDDFRVVGMEQGLGKREGKCGKLIVERDAGTKGIVRVGVGSGLTDYDAENIKEENGKILYLPQGSQEWVDIKGKLVEVHYDSVTEDGSLRFPSIKGHGPQLIRTDK